MLQNNVVILYHQTTATMTAATRTFLMARAAEIISKREKGFSDFRKDIIVNGKYNRSGIMKLVHFEVKKSGRSLSDALKYVWGMAISQMRTDNEDRTGWTKYS
jgi:hypothetical protein